MNEIVVSAPRSEPVAPPAYTNRSALSEAWYRALYAPQPHTGGTPNANRRAAANAAGAEQVHAAPSATRAARRSAGGVTAAAHPSRTAAGSLTVQRFRPARNASSSANPIAWRTALTRRTRCRLTLPDGGKLDLFVHQRAHRVHIIAVAGAAAAARRLDGALARARAALVLHGIRADIELREKGTV